uniref:Uncharacterized protein n=1 Tax=Anguilla anguilla TaxID=7936 RepID=A0A0E9XNN3_ANGAN
MQFVKGFFPVFLALYLSPVYITSRIILNAVSAYKIIPFQTKVVVLKAPFQVF